MKTQLQSSCEIFNHIASWMKNHDNATLITISPCFASLGSNPTILIITKPNIRIINVLEVGVLQSGSNQTQRW
jgi:hypothetical protein